MNKEHPIIFNTESVKAILDGRKTQTRRVMKPQPELIPDDVPHNKGQDWWWSSKVFQSMVRLPDDIGCMPSVCPYGQVGSRLWVRETHYRYGRWVKNGLTKTGRQKWTFKATTDEVLYYDDAPEKLHANLTREHIAKERLSDWYKRPSIFMPRWASRITLEITEVSVERLQEISSGDCMKEGIEVNEESVGQRGIKLDYKFRTLWDSLNAKRGYGWEVNPWVWVISFDLLEGK